LMAGGRPSQHRLPPQAARQSSPVWSASRLYFVSDLDGTNDLWSAFGDGTSAAVVHKTRFDETEVAISPIGGLAFTRRRPAGNSHIQYQDQYDYQDGYRAATVTQRGEHIDEDPDWVPVKAWQAAEDAQTQENLVVAADAAQ